ncbi:MAG: restriction endonuclease subunit S [Thermoguttaceae bacterium]|nr:restriction endonuclease subunit S [Thermoguttaceae bacterium]
MLQKCAGIREYSEELPNGNVTGFECDDILLSNIRPYLQKLWLATFSGGCSNDVLVLRAKDKSVSNPSFYAAYLKRPAFFEYIMQDVNGAKMPRGKKDHIISFTVPVVDIKKQIEIANIVTAVETQIKEAEKKLEELSRKTYEILQSMLSPETNQE